MPRNSWNLGKVVRIICSPDGVAKGAELKTEKGILKRPLNLLCPIEMDSDYLKMPHNDSKISKVSNNSSNDSKLLNEVEQAHYDISKIDGNVDEISSELFNDSIVENVAEGIKPRPKAAVTGELKRRLVDEK